jgi:hypothetical protein
MSLLTAAPVRHTTSASNLRVHTGLLVGKPVGMHTRGSGYSFPRVGHGSEFETFTPPYSHEYPQVSVLWSSWLPTSQLSESSEVSSSSCACGMIFCILSAFSEQTSAKMMMLSHRLKELRAGCQGMQFKMWTIDTAGREGSSCEYTGTQSEKWVLT